MKRTSSIWVTFQREGFHCYPAALENPALTDVRFLGFQHRHMFHWRVEIDVFHDDRDIEFILFKRELEALYDSKSLQLDNSSCEMIAQRLIDYLEKKYPGRNISVTVSEDLENGATVRKINDE